MNRKSLVLLILSTGSVLTVFYFSTTTPERINNYEWHPELNKRSNNRTYPENLPNAYFDKKTRGVYTGRLPHLSDLQFSQNWQVQKTSNGDLHLLNAFLDDRRFSPDAIFFKRFHTVRIVGMYNNLEPKNIHCKIFYENFDQAVVKSDFYSIWRREWSRGEGLYQPYIFSCETPDARVPISVSLIESGRPDPTNNLKVFFEKVDKKKDFVVCVKGLNFPSEDISARLVEWLELTDILGADRVHFYQYYVHPNVQKVLNYYESLGRIEVTPLNLVGEISNARLLEGTFPREERRLQEVVVYVDCFYKYFSTYKYVVNVDIDEVILPRYGTWRDLMKTLHARNGLRASYLARNVYFFDQFGYNSSSIPSYMHILRHVERAKEHSKPGESVKGFHDTERVIALYNHISLNCFGFWGCDNVNIDLNLAQMQHYRKGCIEEVADCDRLKRELVFDAGVWRFHGELIGRVRKVLTGLGLLNE